MFMFNVKLSKRAILVANYGLFHDGHKKHLEDLLISLSIRFLTQDQDGETIYVKFCSHLHLVTVQAPELELLLKERPAHVGGVVQLASPGRLKVPFHLSK